MTSDMEAIVSDGITREPIGISDFKSVTTSEFLDKYPRPSGGFLASKAVVDNYFKIEGSLFEKLKYCNNCVKVLNNKYIGKCDYLENDYYGVVTVCCKLNDDYLDYAYICDCGLIVYDILGNIKFQTVDDKITYCDPFIDTDGVP